MDVRESLAETSREPTTKVVVRKSNLDLEEVENYLPMVLRLQVLVLIE